MVLSCIKRFDLTEKGWSGFLSFCKENVDWGSSWARAIVRLVESPLDLVKSAAAAGILPLRVAVQAPGRVQVDEQEAWIGGEVLQEPSPSRPRVTFRDRDKDIITRARALARVCLKRDGPLTVLDAYIKEKWREHVPGQALEEGRTPPPAPEPRELDFGWAESAPGEALLGPWRPPVDLDDALAQLEAVQTARRERLSLLACGFAVAHLGAYWIDAGHDTPWAYAEQELGWSRRTAQRYRKLGWALIWYPQLDEALREGFSPEAARDIGGFARGDADCDRLIDLAWRLGPRDLKEALANGGERLGDYQRALATARRHEDALLGPDGPTVRPSGTTEVVRIGIDEGASSAGTGRRDQEPAQELDQTTASNAGSDTPDEAGATNAGTRARRRRVRFRIALLPSEPEPEDFVRGDPDLLEASRWFLENNPLRRLSGFAACKERARYCCENPECWRLGLDTEAHHMQFRQYGGSDDPDNAVSLCPSCHGRCVHTVDERIRVTRVELEGLRTRLWEFKGRTPVLQFVDVPPRPSWPRLEAA